MSGDIGKDDRILVDGELVTVVAATSTVLGRCFTTLAEEQDRAFSDFASRSMALEVVALLGWRATEDFERDMRSLA